MWWQLASLVLGGVAAAFAASLVVDYFLTEKNIGDAVKEENSDAFKLIIKEKKKKAVDVGIFNKKNKEIGETTIESSKGVSKSLHKGQVIYV